MALCDRIAVMQVGRLVQVDAPWHAYEAPSEAFVADFLGRSNRLPTQAGQGSGMVAGHRFALPAGLADAAGAIMLTIRPERLRVLDASAPGLGGQVQSRAFLGSSWMYQVSTAIGPMVVTVQNTGAPPLEEGAAVALDWDPHSLRRLDAPS